MHDFPAAVAFLCIYMISAFGWGRLVSRIIYKQPSESIAYDIALGLAIWIWMGGILNSARLINSLSLNAILAAGLMFCLIYLYRYLQQRRRQGGRLFSLVKFDAPKVIQLKKIIERLPLIFILAVSVFLAVKLLPAFEFNHHDDYYKYLPRLFRLLQTGTVGGTPFDFVGIDSFGAQSLLQVFFLEHLSFEFINGFDAVLCFLLGGLLVNDLGRKMNLNLLYRSGAVIVYFLINPQFVNISALYSGSLIILATIYSYILFQSRLPGGTWKEILRAAIPISLLVSSLVVLKITFVPFAITSFLTFFIMLLLTGIEHKKIAVTAGGAVLLAAGIIGPWLWGTIPNILILINKSYSKILRFAEVQSKLTAGPSFLKIYLTPDELSYGGNVLEYTFMIALILAGVLGAIYLMITDKTARREGYLALAVSTGISLAVAFLLNVKFAHKNPFVGIRYTCPLLIAVLPLTILLMSKYLGLRDDRHGGSGMKGYLRIFCVFGLLSFVIVILFPGWLHRLNRISQYRTMLAYKLGESFLQYQRKILSEEERTKVLDMQGKTEPGTTILAWFETPFHLDFARNRIFTVVTSGQINPNVGLNERFAGGEEWLRDYLQNYGVRYVLWGYKGTPKEKSKANKGFNEVLFSLGRNSKILYNDGEKVIFDIAEQKKVLH